eukprot:Clim_evm1s141 gene=Clim_evmTU1s141
MLRTCAALLAVNAALAKSTFRRDPDPGYCPEILYTADVNIWDDIYNLHQVIEDLNFFHVMNGSADMRPLSQFVISQGTAFEDYMAERMGNFQVLDLTTGSIDPWKSMLWKLNALAGPILAAPYEIDRTDANADEWDGWYNALHDLTPSGVLESDCNADAHDPSFKPWAVGFPAYLDSQSKEVNLLYAGQKANFVETRVWSFEQTGTQLVAPVFYSAVAVDICPTYTFKFAEEIAEQTTSSTAQTYSDSYSSTNKIEVTAKESAKIFGLGLELTQKLTQQLSESSTVASTTGDTYTYRTSTEVEHDFEFNFPDQSFYNVTIFIDQVLTTVGFTADLVYDPDTTGIQVWIQGNRIAAQDGFPNILLGDGYLTTPAKIKNVAEKAMRLIGAEWSDAFLNTLVSPSVSGVADTQIGTRPQSYGYACDVTKVDNECTKELALLYPPPSNC